MIYREVGKLVLRFLAIIGAIALIVDTYHTFGTVAGTSVAIVCVITAMVFTSRTWSSL